MRRSFAVLLAAVLAALPLAGCKVVYDRDRAAKQGGFDAAAYVDRIWDSRVVPRFVDASQDAGTVLDAAGRDPDEAGRRYGHRAGEGNAWVFAVHGQGTVVEADTASRRGLLTVEVSAPSEASQGAPREAPRRVVLQVGPVVQGTALRDGLPFVSFNDFANQIDYAQFGRALNARAVQAARAGLDPAQARGAAVRFAGAAVLADGTLQVVPVRLAPAGAGDR